MGSKVKGSEWHSIHRPRKHTEHTEESGLYLTIRGRGHMFAFEGGRSIAHDVLPSSFFLCLGRSRARKRRSRMSGNGLKNGFARERLLEVTTAGRDVAIVSANFDLLAFLHRAAVLIHPQVHG